MSPIDQLNPMQRYLVHEFVEDYEDGLLSRRDMMSRVLHITGGVAATATLLTALGVRSAGAQGETPAGPNGPRSPLSVPENDERILATNVVFAGADEANVRAYQVSPAEVAYCVVVHTSSPSTDVSWSTMTVVGRFAASYDVV